MTLKTTEDYYGLGNTRHCRKPGFHWEEAEKFVKHTAKYIALLSIIFIFFSTNALLLGQGVKLIEKIKFSPETELPLKSIAFCVTEDEVFIIPDYQAGNIKVYEINGKYLELIKIYQKHPYIYPNSAIFAVMAAYEVKHGKKRGMSIKIIIYNNYSA